MGRRHQTTIAFWMLVVLGCSITLKHLIEPALLGALSMALLLAVVLSLATSILMALVVGERPALSFVLSVFAIAYGVLLMVFLTEKPRQ